MKQFRSLANLFRGSVVDGHRMREKAEVLFEVGIHHEEYLALVRRAVLEDLLEQVSDSLHLAACQPLDDLGQICHPYLIHMRPLE